MPTITGVIICIWASWPLIDWLKYADIIEVLPTIIAKDTIGHKALRELSSIAWYNGFSSKGLMRVPTQKNELADIVKKYAQKQQDINIEAKRQKLREKRIKEGKA